jgi:outer membrane lipase/esterase
MIARIWLVALAGFVAAAPAGAVPLNRFTSFYVLGDSLSDVGNVYDSTLEQVPESPPYWRGRFSNGPVWADRVARRFERKDIETGNLAWGGALADGPGVPDIGLQATQYRLEADDRGDRPLVALWAGGNDILNASRERTRKEGRQAARAVGDAARSLRRAGVRDLLIFDLPDLGQIPEFRRDDAGGDAASAGSRVFNRQLGKQIADVEDRGVRVYEASAFALLQDIIADPESYGLRNVRRPCLVGDDVCGRRQGLRRAFFDDMHPNRRVHKALADVARDAIAGRSPAVQRLALAPTAAPVDVAPVPVPAPGLMLVAAVGIAGVWRRRALRAPR